MCLDALRSRRSRREDVVDEGAPEAPASARAGSDPEQEAVVADSVGRALLVVLDALGPAERVAFVLHDVFGVPFRDIAPIVERSPAATKKLAGRARSKVRAGADRPEIDLQRHQRIIEAFLAAVPAGDMDALLTVLAPGVVRRVDPVALPPGVPAAVRGARAVVEEARVFSQPARRAEPAVVDGALGAAVFEGGEVVLALSCTLREGMITEFEVIVDPVRLGGLSVTRSP